MAAASSPAGAVRPPGGRVQSTLVEPAMGTPARNWPKLAGSLQQSDRAYRVQLQVAEREQLPALEAMHDASREPVHGLGEDDVEFLLSRAFHHLDELRAVRRAAGAGRVAEDAHDDPAPLGGVLAGVGDLVLERHRVLDFIGIAGVFATFVVMVWSRLSGVRPVAPWGNLEYRPHAGASIRGFRGRSKT
jgi:hypothetical protein